MRSVKDRSKENDGVDLYNSDGSIVFSCNPNSTVDTIEEEAQKLIEKIRSGLHAELERRATALQKARDRKIASCDRHRKLQIRNINQIYEYEVEDANAIFRV